MISISNDNSTLHRNDSYDDYDTSVLLAFGFRNSSMKSVQIINTNLSKWFEISELEIAPIFLLCCAINLAAICAFLRSGFILKLFSMILAVLGQVTTLHYSDLYVYYNHLYAQNR